ALSTSVSHQEQPRPKSSSTRYVSWSAPWGTIDGEVRITKLPDQSVPVAYAPMICRVSLQFVSPQLSPRSHHADWHLIPVEIRPNSSTTATALGADEVGLDIRQCTRAHLSAAL